MSAKTGALIAGRTLEEQRAECRRRYRAGAGQFTEPEQAALRALVAKIQPAVHDDYPAFAQTPWSFLKVADRIEGGLPHTRGPHIILSERACRGLCSPGPRGSPDRSALATLLHEQMHVFQRAHPQRFDSLYTRQWRFLKADSITGCPWLVEHHLANPDALDCRWVFPIRQPWGTRYIWPLVVFGDGPGAGAGQNAEETSRPVLKGMPQDFQMLAIEVEKTDGGFRVRQQSDGRPVAEDLLGVRPYREVFSPTTNIYHPHEASADLFAMLVVWDHFVPKGVISEQHRKQFDKLLGPLRTWFRANLGLSGAKPAGTGQPPAIHY
jgi:hypothetical protein